MKIFIEKQIEAMEMINPFQGIIYFRSNPGGRPGSGGGSSGRGNGGYYDQPYRGWVVDPTVGGKPVTPDGSTYPLRQDPGIGYGNDGGHRDGPDPGHGRGNRGR